MTKYPTMKLTRLMLLCMLYLCAPALCSFFTGCSSPKTEIPDDGDDDDDDDDDDTPKIGRIKAINSVSEEGNMVTEALFTYDNGGRLVKMVEKLTESSIEDPAVIYTTTETVRDYTYSGDNKLEQYVTFAVNGYIYETQVIVYTLEDGRIIAHDKKLVPTDMGYYQEWAGSYTYDDKGYLTQLTQGSSFTSPIEHIFYGYDLTNFTWRSGTLYSARSSFKSEHPSTGSGISGSFSMTYDTALNNFNIDLNIYLCRNPHDVLVLPRLNGKTNEKMVSSFIFSDAGGAEEQNRYLTFEYTVDKHGYPSKITVKNIFNSYKGILKITYE